MYWLLKVSAGVLALLIVRRVEGEGHVRGPVVDAEVLAVVSADAEGPGFGIELPFAMDQDVEAESSSCASHNNCTTCYDSSSFCHWCESDQACHAKGSVHGCVSGARCSKKEDHKRNDTDAHGCYQQTSCSQCALSSRFCHWCAHDNACHVVGSVYGCVAGVDCYSNERCQRKQPETIPRTDQFRKVKTFYLVLMIGAIVSFICCATCFWGVTAAIKGAYDEVLDGVMMDRDESHDLRQPLIFEDPLSRPSMAITPEIQDSITPAETTTATTTTTASAEQQQTEIGAEEDVQLHQTFQSLPQPDEMQQAASYREYLRLMNGSQTSIDPSEEEHMFTEQQHSPPRRRHSKGYMHRLYQSCTAFYILILATSIFAITALITLYPKIPQYNVCNDAVAWKSLIDSLANLKVTADFELLMSVANPNAFNVAVDTGKGSFSHNGVFVGTFDIPAVTAAAYSITDVMIMAHLSPEKWEALSLTTDYYLGKLVLDVDAKATLRVPALWDFTYALTVKDQEVHVNALSDRHLCACPTWNDNRTASVIMP